MLAVAATVLRMARRAEPGEWGMGWLNAGMADLRRSGPEPLVGMPRIEHRPGLAKDMLAELAPLLAEDGIDLSDPDGPNVPDMATLQRALDRAVERRNMMLFSPVGKTRLVAVVTLRLIVEAIAEGDGRLAGVLLDTIVPESPDDEVATVSACMGVCLGLLDEWLTGNPASGSPAGHTSPPARRDESEDELPPQVWVTPRGLAKATRVPGGKWTGQRAATDVLALARKGRAFDSLGSLIARQGSPQLLAGCVLALTGAVQAWADALDLPPIDVARAVIR